MLPEYYDDAGSQHEHHEDNDEAENGNGCNFRGEAVGGGEEDAGFGHVQGNVVAFKKRGAQLQVVLIAQLDEEGSDFVLAVVLVSQIVETDVQSYVFVEGET